MTISKVISRAWSDAEYKAKLLSDPAAVLAEAGVEIPAGTTIKVVENTAETNHLVLPRAPEGASELSDDALEKIAAASNTRYRQRSTPGVY